MVRSAGAQQCQRDFAVILIQVYVRSQMGAEEDHQLHKTEESYSRKVSKTPGDFNYGAHTPTVHKSQDNLEAVDRRANQPFPMTASYSSQEEQAMRTEE